MKIRDVFISWDFIAAAILGLSLFLILPSQVSQEFIKDMAGIAISVLSIIFSVFFAALAIIISSGEDEFISFLEETNDFTAIVQTFKFTMVIIFLALIFSISYYGITSFSLAYKPAQPREAFILFVFLFIYALFCACNASHDAITYSKCRARFIKVRK